MQSLSRLFLVVCLWGAAFVSLLACTASTPPVNDVTTTPETTETAFVAEVATPTTAEVTTDVPVETVAPTESATAAEPTMTASPTIPPTPTPLPLDPRWYEDSDGNSIPNFVEEEAGFDPTKDDCSIAVCNGVEIDISAVLKAAEQEYNLLLILDASGSMAGDAGGESKMEAAKAVLTRYVETAPSFVNIGLLVYGHTGNNTDAGRAESCAGAELLAPLGEFTGNGATDTLNQFQPTGWTPIASALALSRQAFAGQETANNRIVLITDGLETCDGDPVSEARALIAEGYSVVVDVVGFGVTPEEDPILSQIAEATGGTYYRAGNRTELDAYFDDYIDQLEEALNQVQAAFSCNVNAKVDAAICKNNLFTAAFAAYRKEYDLAIEASNQPARDSLDEILSAISDWNDNYVTALVDDVNPRLQALVERHAELLTELTAARQRRAGR